MPMSAAAMSGIQVHGHRWRLEISFNGQPARLSDEDSLKVGDCADIRDHIVATVRKWLEMRHVQEVLGADDRSALEAAVDDLDMSDDDPDELKHALNELYDQFDFYRVCVVR